MQAREADATGLDEAAAATAVATAAAKAMAPQTPTRPVKKKPLQKSSATETTEATLPKRPVMQKEEETKVEKPKCKLAKRAAELVSEKEVRELSAKELETIEEAIEEAIVESCVEQAAACYDEESDDARINKSLV